LPRAYLPGSTILAASVIRSLLGLAPKSRSRAAQVPDGRRIYAIGDIHGRVDLLDRLLDLIRADDDRRERLDTQLILLGDLVDRGPDSRGVVERAMELRDGPIETRFLMGNHEEVFVRAVGGDPRALRMLLRIGGRETVLSYGISAEEYRSLDFEDLSALLKQKVPQDHVDFLAGFEDWIEAGDYLFVHAGIRPGVDLAEQSSADMRWIRQEFLHHRESHGRLVVHGHSITDDVDLRSNRIGIDTGAFASGRLTAIGLEGADRWFLST
jgi:serine/threonine protein phosphatase 1